MRMRGAVAALVAVGVLASSRVIAAQSASRPADSAAYPHATEPIGTVRQMYDGALTPEMAVHTFRNIRPAVPNACSSARRASQGAAGVADAAPRGALSQMATRATTSISTSISIALPAFSC